VVVVLWGSQGLEGGYQRWGSSSARCPIAGKEGSSIVVVVVVVVVVVR